MCKEKAPFCWWRMQREWSDTESQKHVAVFNEGVCDFVSFGNTDYTVLKMIMPVSNINVTGQIQWWSNLHRDGPI